MDSISLIFKVALLFSVVSHATSQFMPQMQFPNPMHMMQNQMPPLSPMSMPNPMQSMGGMPMGGMPPMGMPPMPMPIAMRQPKLPLVVMPFRKKSKSERKSKKSRDRRRRERERERDSRRRNKELEESNSGGDESEGSGDVDRRRNYRASSKKSHQVLTPVISYITKDGYVVYQKKIKKERAKDWLELGKKKEHSNFVDMSAEHSEPSSSDEVHAELMKQRKRRN